MVMVPKMNMVPRTKKVTKRMDKVSIRITVVVGVYMCVWSALELTLCMLGTASYFSLLGVSNMLGGSYWYEW